jgi:hypothetical protein
MPARALDTARQGVAPSRRFALVPLGPPLLSYSSTCKVRPRGCGFCVLLAILWGSTPSLTGVWAWREGGPSQLSTRAAPAGSDARRCDHKATSLLLAHLIVLRCQAMLSHNDAAKRVELVVDRDYQVGARARVFGCVCECVCVCLNVCVCVCVCVCDCKV